jgi:hypothetical protein
MDTLVYSVSRKERSSEKLLRGTMIALAVLFLIEGILFSTGFMLPCFLSAMAYFWYAHASRREWEYTMDRDSLRIERVSDRGRFVLHEIKLTDVELLCRPDDPAAAPYRKGGTVKIKKYDYTSYRDDVPYYTMIASEEGERIKLLLDLTPEAIARVRHRAPGRVKC